MVNKKVVLIREEQLTFGKLLGEGNFGKVFAGEYRDEHGTVVCNIIFPLNSCFLIDSFFLKVPVAIKSLKATMDTRSREDMKKEAFVMKELSHPCIVRLYGVSQSRKLGSTLMVCVIFFGDMFFIIIWLQLIE